MDLFRAAKWNNIGRVREYLDSGANPNIIDRSYNNYTALIYASSRGRVEIVELLLDRGAVPDIRNDQGDTALMIAERRGHNDVARLIRDHIGLQKARQRLAFATYLLGDKDDLDYDVTARMAKYLHDLDQYGSGRRRSKRNSRKRKNYTRRRRFF